VNFQMPSCVTSDRPLALTATTASTQRKPAVAKTFAATALDAIANTATMSPVSTPAAA
jgi:hypothetical protein